MNMYLHLGKECTVADREIVGIFDLDTTTVGKRTREYLARAERDRLVEKAFDDIPLSFAVCDRRIILSGLSTSTLKRRSETAETKWTGREDGGTIYE